MCGIAGIYTPNQPLKDTGNIQSMTTALAHRGPNDEGIWCDDQIALGHRRLSIIDLSAAGHQPMFSADGRYVIIFNGEIYNFQELRASLDYPYQSGTDTEVILAAYIRWGKDMLQHLNGMFAFAIWDRAEHYLLIARDQMGIKPLYYAYLPTGGLVFASEVRSILASGFIKPTLNESALVDYLRYQTVHAPHTILNDIHALLPGCYIEASTENIQQGRYWNLPDQVEYTHQKQDRSVVLKQIQTAFFGAVERQLVADVPFGAFLSGGIDSSAIVAAMSRIIPGQVNTFTISFEEEAYDEAPYAALIAQKFKTDHHNIRLSANDFLDLLPDALSAMDQPSGDGPNSYVVCKATRAAGITMALSGLGGDELFAGYPIFRRIYKLAFWRWIYGLPMGIRRAAGENLKWLNTSIASAKTAVLLAQHEFALSNVYPISRQVLLDEQIKSLLDTPTLPKNTVETLLQALEKQPAFKNLPLFSRISIAEMHTYMQNVLLRDTDQMSMAHALEVRVPFLDHRFVAMVMGYSDTTKYPNTPKQLFTEAMGKLLPSEITSRPKKGFTLPFAQWMKKELRPFCEEHLQRLAARPPFREETILNMWQRFLAGDKSLSWSRLWSLVVLEDWLSRYQI